MKNIFRGQALKCHIWELKNCALEPFENENWQEYTEPIKLIYEYRCSCENANNYNVAIGNIIRQVLEVFAILSISKELKTFQPMKLFYPKCYALNTNSTSKI